MVRFYRPKEGAREVHAETVLLMLEAHGSGANVGHAMKTDGKIFTVQRISDRELIDNFEEVLVEGTKAARDRDAAAAEAGQGSGGGDRGAGEGGEG